MLPIPDELLSSIFELLPIEDLKALRLCQRGWSVLVSRILFRKATFCLAQARDKRNEQFDFLTTPLTCMNGNMTPGHLVRDLLVHHQQKSGPLAVLPRLNCSMPSITHLEINECRCFNRRDWGPYYVFDSLNFAPLPIEEYRRDPHDEPSIDAYEAWQAATNEWSCLQSIAIHSLQMSKGGQSLPAATPLMTHLNLGKKLQLDVYTFFDLPSLFPSLRFLSSTVDNYGGDNPTPGKIANALLNHLEKLRKHHEMGKQDGLSPTAGLVWSNLTQLELEMFFTPLEGCYYLLVLAMIAPNLAKLTYNQTSHEHDTSNPVEVPPETVNACLLSNGYPPSFKALQSVEITNASINTMMASALFRTTEQLEQFHLEWTSVTPVDGEIDNEIRDYSPEHPLFQHLRALSKPSLRNFYFGYRRSIYGSQFLASIDVPAFAHLVTLKFAGVREICMEKVLEQLPRLEHLEFNILKCGNHDNGAPIVNYPVHRVPHVLKTMSINVLYRQYLVALKNLDNINPGTIHYRFTSSFGFDPATKAPNEDDTLFTWLVPDAQKMVMGMHQWADSPNTDVRLSWMCFPSSRLAGLDLTYPTMCLSDSHVRFSHVRDEFGAIVVYQAEPGPGDSKLSIYHIDKDGWNNKSLKNELELVDSLKALQPVLKSRQKKNRKGRFDVNEHFGFGIVGPSTATVLLVLATNIQTLKVNTQGMFEC
ncbi:hypothetical protein BC940DRAFT_301392 [Gongronella butleri]|nr:hypothetical protein BC940DRAFT_301392 [Gongronella butleri]